MTRLALYDDEFGTIAVRVNSRAKRLLLRIKSDQTITITIPHKRHLRLAEQLLNDSVDSLRERQQPPITLQPNQMVGNQLLVFQSRAGASIRTYNRGDTITVRYPLELSWEDQAVQQAAKNAAAKALREQAKTYLPTRLRVLADEWGITCSGVSINSATTRWGSCTNDGRIHLSLWLMQLPKELVDYVLCHELCHILQHNHSSGFWQEVSTRMPDYKERRKQLKAHSTHWQTV